MRWVRKVPRPAAHGPTRPAAPGPSRDAVAIACAVAGTALVGAGIAVIAWGGDGGLPYALAGLGIRAMTGPAQASAPRVWSLALLPGLAAALLLTPAPADAGTHSCMLAYVLLDREAVRAMGAGAGGLAVAGLAFCAEMAAAEAIGGGVAMVASAGEAAGSRLAAMPALARRLEGPQQRALATACSRADAAEAECAALRASASGHAAAAAEALARLAEAERHQGAARQFDELKRCLARELHPDLAGTDASERCFREQIFKSVWSRLAEIERRPEAHAP